jgi:hypothetical protein
LKKRDDDEYGIWEQGPYDEYGICVPEPYGAELYGAYVQYVQYKATLPLPTKKLEKFNQTPKHENKNKVNKVVRRLLV